MNTTRIPSPHLFRSGLATRVLALPLLLLPLLACDSHPPLDIEPEPEPAPAASLWNFTEKLQSCGLASDGIMLGDGVGLDEQTRCYYNCIAEATCEQLDILYCGDGEELAWQLHADCEATCYDDDLSFVCTNGESIPYSWKCDDYQDCQDASDEASCAQSESFTCDDGTQIAPDWQCDDYQDCDDGSDEVGCAQLTCQ